MSRKPDFEYILQTQPLERKRHIQDNSTGPVFAQNRLIISGQGESLERLFKRYMAKPLELDGCKSYRIRNVVRVGGDIFRDNVPELHTLVKGEPIKPIPLGNYLTRDEDEELAGYDDDDKEVLESYVVSFDPPAKSEDLKKLAQELVEQSRFFHDTEDEVKGFSVNHDHVFSLKRVPFLSPFRIKGGSLNITPYATTKNQKTVEDVFRDQPCWDEIGLSEQLLASESDDTTDGDSSPVTVVIFDTAPDIKAVHSALTNNIIQYYIDMKPGTFIPSQKPQDMDLKMLHRWSSVRETPPIFTDKGKDIEPEDLVPYHGVLAASLIHHIVPKAQIILVNVFDHDGETTGSTLTGALDLILRICDNPVEIYGEEYLKIDPSKLVYNLSLGIPRSLAEYVDAGYLLKACKRACKKGMYKSHEKPDPTTGAVIVAAAGNDSYYLHMFNPEEPAAYGFYNDDWDVYNKTIAVAGSRIKSEEYVLYSNQGNLAAPGDYLLMDTGNDNAPFGRYVYWAGTSFATPLVSGAAAFLLQKGYTSDIIKNQLWKGATQNAINKNFTWKAAPIINLVLSL